MSNSHVNRDSDKGKRHVIPGPAGIVQAALRRRAKGKAHVVDETSTITTQDYVARELQKNDSSEGFAADFSLDVWQEASSYFDPEDEWFSYDPSWAICRILEGRETKIPKVQIMITKLTPNGWGDYMVEFKDPTGTILGTISRNVCNEIPDGNHLHVGTVLLLKNVTKFQPNKQAYLNITCANVVKVFLKNMPEPPPTSLSEN